ncbi:MAG: branched-chain amino acid ABC transporter permease [Desulfobacterales bacterium]|nr:MAG: branched-chain amino acid ABC transporter permease [Desulfobacterales bacterium]
MKKNVIGAGIAILIGVAVPLVFRSYWLHVAIIALYYALLASSWTMLAGFSGQFSFATMALGGIGAYTSALLVINVQLPMWLALICGALAATVVGLLIGVLVLRMRGPYLALFTIAFSELVRITLNAEYQLTRGDMGLTVPHLYTTVSKTPYYYTMLGLLVGSLLVMWTVLRSRYGLFFRAIREQEEAAAVMGVNVVRYKIMAFVISSFFAGLAGSFFAHYIGTLTPNSMMEIPRMGLLIAMSVIGGIESLAGAVAGAVLVEFLQEYLRALEMWRFVIFGLALVLILRFSQNGLIYPIYQRFAARRVEPRTVADAEA